MPIKIDFKTPPGVVPIPESRSPTGQPPPMPGITSQETSSPQQSSSGLTFNDYIANGLPYDVRSQIYGWAANIGEPQHFYDPSTGWFGPGTIKSVIYTLLTAYGAQAGLGQWMIMARQRYPAGVQNLFADIVIADPNDGNHYVIIEASASMNSDDALSDAAKLASFMDQDWGLRVEGYVFFALKNEAAVRSCKERINNYISENFDSKVTPVGTTP